MKHLLVTSAGGRLAIGFCDALRIAPEPMYIAGVDSDKFGVQRAVADEKHVVPKAAHDDYVPVLNDIISEAGIDLLMVQLSAELLPVSAARDRLRTRIFLPSHRTLTVCDSKWDSYEHWRRAGVPVPASMFINTEADLRYAFRQLGGTLWLRAIRGTGGKGSLPVSDYDKAKRWIDFWNGWGDFMAAQLLSKETVTWESIWWEGELIVAQGRRRLYWEFSNLTPSGVTGITGASVTLRDAVVDDTALRAILAIDPKPHGIMSVDMAYDNNGIPSVTEINAGRFMSGGIILYAQRGLNMPYLAVQLALGEKPNLSAPVLNPLPNGIVCVRGLDTKPILTTMAETERRSRELEERRNTMHGVKAAAVLQMQ